MTHNKAFDTASLTLIDVFLRHAEQRGADRAYVFLAANGEERDVLTFAELARDMKAIASNLLARGNRRGDRVLLMHASGLDFIRAFLGTIYAGMIAVPAMVPRANEGTARLARISDDAGVSALLTTDDALDRMQRTDPVLHAHLAGIRVGSSCDAIDRRADVVRCKESAAAFLQYTSGSTGTPKGVVVTHANLIHNQRLIAEAFGHDTHTTTVVGWLPMYHDMGLIGNVLQPLFLGRTCILMSPGDFMMRPIRWLRAIERYRATTSGGPNFAYALCSQKVSDDEAASLDLSSWRVAFNGAEPVRATTMVCFARKFSASRFSGAAFYPCYGLAESTLFVTGPDHRHGARFLGADAGALQPLSDSLGAELPGHDQHVSCGRPFDDTVVEVVDAQTRQPCACRNTGEVWISGTSVAQGYHGQPEQTGDTFGSTLASHPGRRFLRTGDLGFLSEDGELFVVGRLKDMIIIRGVNYYAEDVEAVAGDAHELTKGCRVVAFSIDGPSGEELVTLTETPRRFPSGVDVEEIIEAIKGDVAEKIGVAPAQVRLLPYGALPTTTSGKIRRKQCRADFLAGLLPATEVAA